MNRFFKKFIMLSYCIGLSFLCEDFVYAERGDVEQLQPASLPNQNFPEYFDTNIPPERRFMFSVPMGSLTFGATKNFSLSLNLPIIFYMIDTWNPGVLFSLRYRFFSNASLSSALTGYAGYLRYKKQSDDSFKIYYINGTYNNLITVNKNNFITTQLNGLHAKYKFWDDDEVNADTKSLNFISVAVGHIYVFNKKWMMHNLISVPVIFNFYEENNISSGQMSFKHITNFPFFYRIVFDWNVTKNSLLTFGGFMIWQSDIPFIVLPWLNWSIVF